MPSSPSMTQTQKALLFVLGQEHLLAMNLNYGHGVSTQVHNTPSVRFSFTSMEVEIDFRMLKNDLIRELVMNMNVANLICVRE